MKKLFFMSVALLIARGAWAAEALSPAEENLVYLGVSTLVNPTIHETKSILGAAEVIKQILAKHPVRELPREVRLPILKSILTREKIHEGSEEIFHSTSEIVESYISQITSEDETKAKELAVIYSDDLKILAREEGELFTNPLVKMDSDDTIAHRYVTFLRNAIVATCPIETARAVLGAIKAGALLQSAKPGSPISMRLLLDFEYAARRAKNPAITRILMDAVLEISTEHQSPSMRESANELYQILKSDWASCAKDLEA